MWKYLITFISCIDLIHSQITKENVIKIIYGASKDFKTFGLADDLFTENTAKLADLVTKCNDIAEEKCKYLPSECDKWKKTNVNFLNGISLLVKGCQTKSTREYLMGVMNVASALVSARKVKRYIPFLLDAVVLTLQLFGDSTSGYGIDPMRNVLQDFRMTELELDFQGAKEYLELMLNPIPLHPDIPRTAKTLREKQNAKEVPKKYTDDEVKDIIQKGQKPLNMYWKLATLISDHCRNRAIQDETGGTDTLQKCLHLLNLYSELAQTHLAYLLKIIVKIKMSEEALANSDYTGDILYICERRFERDYTTLNFLYNPMTSFDKTKVIYELYTNQDDNRQVMDYLVLLHNKYTLYRKDRIVICKEERLHGFCRELRIQNDTSDTSTKSTRWQELVNWISTKSVFIPPGIEVYLTSNGEDNYKIEPDKKRGPFKGLAVYSSEDKLNMGDITIKQTGAFDISPEVRICTVNGWCDTITEESTYLRNVNGIDFSHESLGNIDVPDGLGVKLIGEDGKILAIVGPFKTKDLHICPNWSWNKIELFQRYESTPRFSNTKVKRHLHKGKRQKVATASTRSEKKSIADERADLKVVACTKPFLKGFCMQYGASFVRSDNLSPFSGGLQTGCKVGIQSMRIPSGILINGVQSFDMQRGSFGPYVGPVLIDKMADGAKYEVTITNLFKEQHKETVASEKVLKNVTVFHDSGTKEHSAEQNKIDENKENKVSSTNQTKVTNSSILSSTSQISNQSISTNESITTTKNKNAKLQNNTTSISTNVTVEGSGSNETVQNKNRTVFDDIPTCQNQKTTGMLLQGKYNNDDVHVNINSCKTKNKTTEGQLSCISSKNTCNNSINIDIFFVKALEKAKHKTVFGDLPCVTNVVCNEKELNEKTKTVFGDCPCAHKVFPQNSDKNRTVFGDVPCFLPLVCEDKDLINKVIDINSKVKSVLKKMPCKMIVHCKNDNVTAAENDTKNLESSSMKQNSKNESLAGQNKVQATNQTLKNESLNANEGNDSTNTSSNQSLILNKNLNSTSHKPIPLIGNKTEPELKFKNTTKDIKERDSNEWVAEFVNDDESSNVTTENKSEKFDKLKETLHHINEIIDDGDEDEDAYAAIEEHKNENVTKPGVMNKTMDKGKGVNKTDEIMKKVSSDKSNTNCTDPAKCKNNTVDDSCEHNNSCSKHVSDDIKPSEKLMQKKVTTVFEDKPLSLFTNLNPSDIHSANNPATVGLIMNKNFTALWKSSCDLPKFCKNAFNNDIRCKVPDHCKKLTENHDKKDISVSYPASLDETYCPIYEDDEADNKILCNKTMNNIKKVINEVNADKINIDFQQLLCNFANRCNKTEDEIKTIKKEILASIIDKVDDKNWCDTISEPVTQLSNVSGIDISGESLYTIEVPEGTLLKLHTNDGKVFPLVGPFKATGLNSCSQWTWSRIDLKRFEVPTLINPKNHTLKRSSVVVSDKRNAVRAGKKIVSIVQDNINDGVQNNNTSGTPLGKKMIEKEKTVSEENDGTDEDRADFKVVVCSKPYLKGFCMQYGSLYYKSIKVVPFSELVPGDCTLNMQSISIPYGMKVTGLQYIKGKKSYFGPYFGPMKINEMEELFKHELEVTNLFREILDKHKSKLTTQRSNVKGRGNIDEERRSKNGTIMNSKTCNIPSLCKRSLQKDGHPKKEMNKTVFDKRSCNKNLTSKNRLDISLC